MPDIVVRPINRARANELCRTHPHAQTMPKTSQHFFAAYIDGRVAGLAAWGYGIMPRRTPITMFGEAGQFNDYFELCRFFVYDWTPKYTATQFLSFTHRIIKKYTDVKWLFTYAAGFQGLIGTIYQAANYDYVGRHLTKSFVYIPDVGLVHSIPLWKRYGAEIGGSNNGSLKRLQKFVPGAKRWCGYNFRYIYWLCDKREKQRLMKSARFEIEPYPTADQMEIWLEDVDGKREYLSPEFAKTIPIVKLKSKREDMRATEGSTLASS